MSKLTRRQIRDLIRETMEQNLDAQTLSEGRYQQKTLTAFAKGTSKNPKASMVMPDSREEVLTQIGGRALERYGKKMYYVLNTDDNMAGLSTNTGKGRILAMAGEISSTGDPYTYNRVGSSRLKVISGPNPKAIGAVFKDPKRAKRAPEPQEEEELTLGSQIGSKVKASSRKSKEVSKDITGSSFD